MRPQGNLRTAAEALVDQLLVNAVRHVFCVPGESYLAVLDAFHDRDLAVTVCRQEGGAATFVRLDVADEVAWQTAVAAWLKNRPRVSRSIIPRPVKPAPASQRNSRRVRRQNDPDRGREMGSDIGWSSGKWWINPGTGIR